jgi:saccharopine dehydrogenase-like NADP-dependent oxidoreductase
VQKSDARKIYPRELGGEVWSAIQITTAAAICAVLDLHAQGSLAAQGFVRQEDIPFDAFINNRFGSWYATPST